MTTDDPSLREVRRCLQALAQPAHVQLTLFPAFAAVGDELAIDFDSALLACPNLFADSDPRRDSLRLLEEELDRMTAAAEPDLWLDPARLASDARWEVVRKRAADVLLALSWPNERPTPNGATYVSRDTTVVKP